MIRLLLVLFVLVSPVVGFAEIYWGDLHVHTYYSKDSELHGLASTEHVDKACEYAKTNGLNFVAVTDHSENDGSLGKMTSDRINGSGMGTVVALSSGETPTLNIVATGDGANITKVEIIKNGDGANPVHTETFNQSYIDYSWTDSSYTSGDFYYVRVIQSNNERAWSSPIWVVTL